MSSCAQDETRTHTILRPLPPQSSVYTNFTTCACPEQDSNLHTSRHAHLKRTRLPIPPSGPYTYCAKKKSGKRDSNSRPRPWQGRALPTELFPHSFYPSLKDHSLLKSFPLQRGRGCPFHFSPFNFQKRVQKYCFFLTYANFFAKKCNISAFFPFFALFIPFFYPFPLEIYTKAESQKPFCPDS